MCCQNIVVVVNRFIFLINIIVTVYAFLVRRYRANSICQFWIVTVLIYLNSFVEISKIWVSLLVSPSGLLSFWMIYSCCNNFSLCTEVIIFFGIFLLWLHPLHFLSFVYSLSQFYVSPCAVKLSSLSSPVLFLSF